MQHPVKERVDAGKGRKVPLLDEFDESGHIPRIGY